MKPAATTSHLTYIYEFVFAIQCKFSCELLRNLLLSQFKEHNVVIVCTHSIVFLVRRLNSALWFYKNLRLFLLRDFCNEILQFFFVCLSKRKPYSKLHCKWNFNHVETWKKTSLAKLSSIDQKQHKHISKTFRRNISKMILHLQN